MLKWNIKYVDFGGDAVEESYYFNISKTELTELELSVKGGFSSYVEHILNVRDTPALMDFFKMFITKSYGEKSLDNKFFDKDPDMTRHFMCSAAYDALYQELIGDPDKASEFILGVVPKDFADAMRKSISVEQAKIVGISEGAQTVKSTTDNA